VSSGYVHAGRLGLIAPGRGARPLGLALPGLDEPAKVEALGRLGQLVRLLGVHTCPTELLVVLGGLGVRGAEARELRPGLCVPARDHEDDDRGGAHRSHARSHQRPEHVGAHLRGAGDLKDRRQLHLRHSDTCHEERSRRRPGDGEEADGIRPTLGVYKEEERLEIISAIYYVDARALVLFLSRLGS
jgi:hypothetical protein